MAQQRFEFGANWAEFLRVVDEPRIEQAQKSLCNMLGVENLHGKTFLDVGSGSGLFSLAAWRLGARVYSFDYDPNSVACTATLRDRHLSGERQWDVAQGSVLDRDFLRRLGRFDVVYSWGVLHHTGDMWSALDNVTKLVASAGRLFIAIYNDQGGRSKAWKAIKRTYNTLPRVLRVPFALCVMAPRELGPIARTSLKGNPAHYFRAVTNYTRHSSRGMSYWHDLVDWVGGYPFEVAKPEEIFEFIKTRGFRLDRLTTALGGHGCNEYVFSRSAELLEMSIGT